MDKSVLSQNSRKALCVQIGDDAGSEIVKLLQELSDKIEQLEHTKVNITAIVPPNSANIIINDKQNSRLSE